MLNLLPNCALRQKKVSTNRTLSQFMLLQKLKPEVALIRKKEESEDSSV